MFELYLVLPFELEISILTTPISRLIPYSTFFSSKHAVLMSLYSSSCEFMPKFIYGKYCMVACVLESLCLFSHFILYMDVWMYRVARDVFVVAVWSYLWSSFWPSLSEYICDLSLRQEHRRGVTKETGWETQGEVQLVPEKGQRCTTG